MKVKQMKSILASNKFDNIECNFKLKIGKPKVTLESLSEKVESISLILLDVMKEIQNIKLEVKSINSRIDNLITKNNLKE